MTEDFKREVDARLGDALRERGLEDSRPVYRQRLRQLRQLNPDAFDRALRHYEDIVVTALAGGADPVATWIEYGQWLAELSSPGRLLAIDGSGRAAPYAADVSGAALVLHVPDDADVASLAVATPIDATAAQRATLDLLVYGRVQLGG